MLSRFSFLALTLSLVSEFTGRMVTRGSRGAKPQVLGIVVLLAELTLTPVRVSAGVQRPLASLNQKVVSAVRTDEQVLGAIIRSDVVPVVDFFGASQIATENAFSYEDVLIDVSACVQSGMSVRAFLNISVGTEAGYSALPRGALFSALPASMLLEEHHGLTSDVSLRGVRLPSERSWLPATALTNTRRIQQDRAPNVCADRFNQSNTFRRLR